MAKKKDLSGAEARSINQPFAALAGLRAAAPAEPGSPAALAGLHAAASPPASAKPPAKPRFEGKLVLQREKKGRGGKTVTRLRGLSLPAGALEALCKELKQGLGCGAVVEEGDVLLQGDQCKRAAEWLEKQGATRVIIGN